MDKSFLFTLYDGSRLSFSLLVYNGQLVTNRFMPDFLTHGADSPFASAILGQMALIDPMEFKQDCRSMISYININRLQTNMDTSYMDALASVLVSHIKRCGRLFFSDLCTYLDEVTYLMHGFGYDEYNLKERTYPQMAYIAIINLKDYVKEGSPLGIIPFTSTAKWTRLKEYCEARHF